MQLVVERTTASELQVVGFQEGAGGAVAME